MQDARQKRAFAADYIADTSYYLADLARQAGLSTCSYLYEMAFLEAAQGYERITGRPHQRMPSEPVGSAENDRRAGLTK
jgi:hypothetical protein